MSLGQNECLRKDVSRRIPDSPAHTSGKRSRASESNPALRLRFLSFRQSSSNKLPLYARESAANVPDDSIDRMTADPLVVIARQIQIRRDVALENWTWAPIPYRSIRLCDNYECIPIDNQSAKHADRLAYDNPKLDDGDPKLDDDG